MDRLRYQREVTRGSLVWVFLSKVEETRVEDGRTQEPQEDATADKVVTIVGFTAVFAVAAQTGKYFSQLAGICRGITIVAWYV